MLDMSPREWAVFAPLIVLTFWMGIYPVSFLDVMHVSVENLLGQVQTALEASGTAVTAGR